MHVCCLNNYPLEKMRALADDGVSPRQHLWGTDRLAELGSVSYAPFHEPFEGNPLDRASRLLGMGFGQLDQQAYAVRRYAGLDAVYAADQNSARGIAMLPAWRRPRVVSVVHNPRPASFVVSLPFRRHDALITLDEQTRRDLVDRHGVDPARVVYAPWGPDLSSPTYGAEDVSEEFGVVSAGKTNRDIPLLAAALDAARQPSVVYDVHRVAAPVRPPVQLVGPDVEATDRASAGAYRYDGVARHLRGASVIAVPIADPNQLTGLTEIDDALALGKPLIVTRSPRMPFDVEAVGCGIEVAPGDYDGWVSALRRLGDDAALRREMGERGRAFAEEHFNYERFCDVVAEAVHGR